MQRLEHAKIRYGAKVIIRDNSALDGSQGIVLKLSETNIAEVLLEREVVWPVQVNQLELVSK